jgi:hypothetical protein
MPKAALTTISLFGRKFLVSFIFSAIFFSLVYTVLQKEFNNERLYSVSSLSNTKLELAKKESAKSSSSANITTLTPTPTLTKTPTPTVAVTPTPAPQVAVDNNPPGSGYSRQTVSIDSGTFTVDIIAADLNTTRVIVDTASDSDCFDNCPVLPLSTYVSRSGGFAGINGSYFCPASYPSCAGKTNSFDLLVMNKNKYYFNSANNVYSTNPAVIFHGNSARFVGRALEWGRDTSVDAVISNFPLLVSGNNPVADGGAKGSKSFIGNKGSTVFMGFVRNATVGETAKVLQALGMENAMGLDQGGSTALMYNGSYILGPGRNIPNAIVLVRK